MEKPWCAHNGYAGPELDRLRAENAALRERVAVLERVREAAEAVHRFDSSRSFMGKLVFVEERAMPEMIAALDAAKDGA